MATALIFVHLALLAIDRAFAHWVSPDATAAETLCVTRRGPLTVGFILPPTRVSLIPRSCQFLRMRRIAVALLGCRVQNGGGEEKIGRFVSIWMPVIRLSHIDHGKSGAIMDTFPQQQPHKRRTKRRNGLRGPVPSKPDGFCGGPMTTLTIGAAMSRRRHHQFDPNAKWISADTNVAIKWLILAYILPTRLQPTDQAVQNPPTAASAPTVHGCDKTRTRSHSSEEWSW
jgi:hypothetical protein